MNCTICGKATLPGAMLCGPCKAALKRARYVTVQEDLRRPSIVDVRRASRRLHADAPAAAATSASVTSPILEPGPIPQMAVAPEEISNRVLGRRIYIGVFVAALALGGASYVGQRELGAREQDKVFDVLTAPPNTAPPGAQNVKVAALSAALAAVDTAPLSVPPVDVLPVLPEASAPSLPTSKAAVSARERRVPPRGSATFATVNGDPPDALNPPPVPEKVAALPAPPPPAPDRWQTLRESIAMCDREGLIGGIICGQKARIQYCEGYWGKVPQCPGPTLNPER